MRKTDNLSNSPIWTELGKAPVASSQRTEYIPRKCQEKMIILIFLSFDPFRKYEDTSKKRLGSCKSERDAQASEEKGERKKRGKEEEEEERLVLSNSSYSIVGSSVSFPPVCVRLELSVRCTREDGRGEKEDGGKSVV